MRSPAARQTAGPNLNPSISPITLPATQNLSSVPPKAAGILLSPPFRTGFAPTAEALAPLVYGEVWR